GRRVDALRNVEDVLELEFAGAAGVGVQGAGGKVELNPLELLRLLSHGQLDAETGGGGHDLRKDGLRQRPTPRRKGRFDEAADAVTGLFPVDLVMDCRSG